MKLSARDASAYFRKPDPNGAGILIYGGDTMRVALKRQEVIKALVGPNGEEEMRLTRMTGAELRKDPALLGDAIKAQGFFPAPMQQAFMMTRPAAMRSKGFCRTQVSRILTVMRWI